MLSSLHDLLISKPYLVDMLRLAFPSGLLMKWQEAIRSLGNDDVAIRHYLLRQLMARARGTHGRPTEAATHYYNALASVAHSAVPDTEGLFTMNTMVLSAPDPESDGKFTFNPYDPLRRSGLVSFIPAARSTMVRFEPVWLQSALVHGAGWVVRTISYWRIFLVVSALVVFSIVVFYIQPHREDGLDP